VISLSKVPELIESYNGQVTMVFPSGEIEISYISEHSLYRQPQSIETWQLLLIVSLPIIAFTVSIFWFLRRKKTQPKLEKIKKEVDVDKLFEKEKNLRPEEVQVIYFLAEKCGTAFEAELYEKLNLPRTTTWRLLKRLEKMEIVKIRKSRRQNIVTIRKKYMKK
ncbi:MAG: winged helix-turn-helix transcriptional regulator, partial [Candidatus Bathyarchaeota archaeon]|nr:winged helix-turn-helix transcriptional regulator [Candidatus Bathyarchaeota archaeon]